jgi:Domain of unknown function (DUF6475)
MDDNAKPQFIIAIGAMFETFGVQSTQPILYGYWLGLNDLSLEQVQLAVASAIRTCNHVPKPAELRELAGCNNSETMSLSAWDDVLNAVSYGPYRHVDFEDKAINAVVRSMGGWPNFVSRFTDAESEKWVRLEFIRCYKVLASRGLSDEAMAPLAGISQFEFNSPERKPMPIRIACRDDNRKIGRPSVPAISLMRGIAQ